MEAACASVMPVVVCTGMDMLSGMVSLNWNRRFDVRLIHALKIGIQAAKDTRS